MRRLAMARGARLISGSSRSLGVGPRISPGAVEGYYIDLTGKAAAPAWPPTWLPPWKDQLHVVLAQWGLGAYERHLAGEGSAWLTAAVAAGRHLLANQEEGGGWPHLWDYVHTYPLAAPWLSAMAQGEGASLLVRLHLATGEDVFATAARRALQPLARSAARGGVRTETPSGPFLEEYPTDPPSLVLNGAIFAIWGYYDAAVGLEDADAEESFQQCVDALAKALPRYDVGFWSRYDLFPHPVTNLASPFYHDLHINQLRALHRLIPRSEFKLAADRFAHYRESRLDRARAFFHKTFFRLLVPRNRVLAHRMPWRSRRPSMSPRV